MQYQTSHPEMSRFQTIDIFKPENKYKTQANIFNSLPKFQAAKYMSSLSLTEIFRYEKLESTIASWEKKKKAKARSRLERTEVLLHSLFQS